MWPPPSPSRLRNRGPFYIHHKDEGGGKSISTAQLSDHVFLLPFSSGMLSKMTSKVPEAKPASPRLKTSKFELVSASHDSCDQPQDAKDQANSARSRCWYHFPFNFQDYRASLQGYTDTVWVTKALPNSNPGIRPPPTTLSHSITWS